MAKTKHYVNNADFLEALINYRTEIELAEKNSMKTQKVDGVVFNPLNQTWNIKSDTSVNYIAQFKKI